MPHRDGSGQPCGWCSSLAEIGEYPLQDSKGAKRQYRALPASVPLDAEDPFEIERAVLQLLGIAPALIRRLTRQAQINGTSIEEELLAQGHIRERDYYQRIASTLGLPFLPVLPAHGVRDQEFLDQQLLEPTQVRIHFPRAAPQLAIVPQAARLHRTVGHLQTMPDLRNGLVITTPTALRKAVWAAGAMRRVRAVVFDLFETVPEASARIVATGKQGILAGFALAALMVYCLEKPQDVLPLLHILLSTAYLCALALRMAALFLVRRQPPPPDLIDLPSPLPRYSVMVALYREGGMVEQLVRSLERLEWPRSLLEIKLVCEADDTETLDALAAMDLPPHFEVVEVPPFHPRTKPKALCYALASLRGDYVSIYDAEDRPHPKQLLEAYRRFSRAPPDVACLQSPLVIANLGESAISALFAMEYAALFRGMLPMLARFRMPLPLGGTSNHFRTSVLRKVGAWDPFNVTEDADLGLRLYRQGFRAETLRYQTLEDAPTTYKVWLGQRVRWFKGWFQTWLVMMRHPVQATREMGFCAMLVFQLLIGGMLVSALLHPIMPVLLIGFCISLYRNPAEALQPIALLDFINMVASYAVFLALGFRCMIDEELRRMGKKWLMLPLYWLMVSRAAWRAANELRHNPFFWNKTKHKPTSSEG